MRVYYHPMATMQAAAEVAGTLGDPARLAILAALLEGEATVSDLAARLDLAQPRVSTGRPRVATGPTARRRRG
jgi:DNA-binding transcriptional ArsR family regulator